MRLVSIIVFCLATATSLSANPSKLAGSARLDLVARSSVGALQEGASLSGGGTVNRMAWVPTGEQARTYTAHWPVRHFSWTDIGISFRPMSNGIVDIDLLGPWEMSPSGTIFKQEVLWDVVAAHGATLTNGSFEHLESGVPAGWSNPWFGPVELATNPPPPDGLYSANAWHDRRLRVSISVTGGVQVEIRASARARMPDGYADNPRILGSNTPAHQAARRFMRGVNFSNFFEAPADQDWGGGPLEPADFDAVFGQGFDHVRLPVSWNYHTGPAPTFTISNAFFARVDAVVTGLLARGVNVLLNLHHFDPFYANPTAWTNKLIAIWDQLAAHYAGFPDGLAFEILNEPHDAATTEFMNGVYAFLLSRIRTNHPNRTIFVGPGGYNSIRELVNLRLPADDSNLVVSVHCYDPHLYTHQGAAWLGAPYMTTNVVYPGPPPEPVFPHPVAAQETWVAEWFHQYNSVPLEMNPCSSNAFESLLQLAHDWSVHYGRPVHVGEFGAPMFSDLPSRTRYYREMRAAMDRRGLGWAAWDWKALYYYWDRSLNAPAPGMREALFPPAVIRWNESALDIVGEAAVGKRFILERAQEPGQSWWPEQTQLLLSPRIEFTNLEPDARAVYRAVWVWP